MEAKDTRRTQRRRTHGSTSPSPLQRGRSNRVGVFHPGREGHTTTTRTSHHMPPSGYRTRPHTRHTAFRSPLGWSSSRNYPPRLSRGERWGKRWGRGVRVSSSINLCSIHTKWITRYPAQPSQHEPSVERSIIACTPDPFRIPTRTLRPEVTISFEPRGERGSRWRDQGARSVT